MQNKTTKTLLASCFVFKLRENACFNNSIMTCHSRAHRRAKVKTSDCRAMQEWIISSKAVLLSSCVLLLLISLCRSLVFQISSVQRNEWIVSCVLQASHVIQPLGFFIYAPQDSIRQRGSCSVWAVLWILSAPRVSLIGSDLIIVDKKLYPPTFCAFEAFFFFLLFCQHVL